MLGICFKLMVVFVSACVCFHFITKRKGCSVIFLRGLRILTEFHILLEVWKDATVRFSRTLQYLFTVSCWPHPFHLQSVEILIWCLRPEHFSWGYSLDFPWPCSIQIYSFRSEFTVLRDRALLSPLLMSKLMNSGQVLKSFLSCDIWRF